MNAVIKVRDIRFSKIDFIKNASCAYFYRNSDNPHDIQAIVVVSDSNDNHDGLEIHISKGFMGVEGSNGGANCLREAFRFLKEIGVEKRKIFIIDVTKKEFLEFTKVDESRASQNNLFNSLLNEVFK